MSEIDLHDWFLGYLIGSFMFGYTIGYAFKFFKQIAEKL